MATGDTYQQISNNDRWIFDSSGQIIGVQNPRSRSGEDKRFLSDAQSAAVAALVSGNWSKGFKLRNLNVHDLKLMEPLMQLDLPSPYSGNFTGLTNKEHAYGTPIFVPNGWRGYRYWMIGAPYPTQVKGTCTISNATPGVATYTAHPFSVGMPITFSTTGALPTGLTAGVPYWVVTTNFSANTFCVATSPGGSAIANRSNCQGGLKNSQALSSFVLQ